MKIKSLALLCSSIILVTSCRKENSESIDQDEIYSEYKAIYHQEHDKTYARLTLRHLTANGENLILGPDGSVVVNGETSEFSKTYYRFENTFAGKSDCNFVFTDNDGTVFNTNIEYTDIAIYNTESASNDTLKKGSVQFIPWDEHGNLSSGETINLVIEQNGILEVISTDTIGVGGVYLTTTSLNKFQLGDAECRFEKWSENTLEASKAGGKAWGQTISSKIKVRIAN